MQRLSALRYGFVFAITVGLLYIACGIATMVAPTAIATVIDAVVHGLNIGSLTRNLPATSLGEVAIGLVYISIYSFIAGCVYGAVRNVLGRST
jgi:hypothetical protein